MCNELSATGRRFWVKTGASPVGIPFCLSAPLAFRGRVGGSESPTGGILPCAAAEEKGEMMKTPASRKIAFERTVFRPRLVRSFYVERLRGRWPGVLALSRFRGRCYNALHSGRIREHRNEGISGMEKRRLGRGLDALLGSLEENGTAPAIGANQVAVERIEHNPYQPRKDFDADELSKLRESIRAHGVLQPLVVRQVGERFQLIAGERRLRAAQSAGLKEVPVRVVDFNDQQVLEAALVENIQRADLNPIEKAHGFKDHLDRFGLTQEQLAARLGLARTSITNLVNLLELPAEVQEAVRLGQISEGHAKVLKGVADRERQVALCREIVARNYSVRETEAVLKEDRPTSTGPAKKAVKKTSHVEAIEEELRKLLATRVEIRLKSKDRGHIVVTFESNDDFERLLEVLRR